MIFHSVKRVLIVGLGLLGGSYARSLHKKGFAVDAITLEQSSIDFAVKNGFVDRGSTKVEPQLVAQADLIVFALYPTVFIDWIKKYQHLFRSGTLITDVTGVKVSVVDEIQNILRDDVEFISAHPMAGRERSGVEYSDPNVFKGANYIITPTDKNSQEATEICRMLGEELGFARISVLSPKEHDEMIAFLSQLTHCIAVTLMTCNTGEGLEKYTGDSFRDLTRIAKINDAMWSELFLMNKDALLAQMDAFSKEFEKLRSMIAGGDRDSMRDMMRRSTQRRSLFDKPKA